MLKQKSHVKIKKICQNRKACQNRTDFLEQKSHVRIDDILEQKRNVKIKKTCLNRKLNLEQKRYVVVFLEEKLVLDFLDFSLDNISLWQVSREQAFLEASVVNLNACLTLREQIGNFGGQTSITLLLIISLYRVRKWRKIVLISTKSSQRLASKSTRGSLFCRIPKELACI